MSNKGPYIAGCQLCKAHEFFSKKEDIPIPWICLCLQKPDNQTDYHVCKTCYRSGWWTRSTIFKHFGCQFCKEEKSNSGKFQIKIMPTPNNPTVHRPNVSINLHEIQKRKKEREEQKRRAERLELAEMIANKLSQKIPSEIIAHELNDK